jgi:hypothetical protein
MKIIKTANKDVLKVTHFDWVKIGYKTGWIKLAESETVEIDGKIYKELDGDLVEIEQSSVPKTTNEQIKEIQSISFNIKGEKIVLREGEQYKNYFGNYLLKLINNQNDPLKSTVTVEYLDGQMIGQTQTYPAKAQALAIYNEKNRTRHEEERHLGIDLVAFDSPDEFFTLGYLAKHAIITVEVPKDLEANFNEKYSKLTGEDAKKSLADGFYYIAPKHENRWYIKCRLIFDINTEITKRLFFPSGINTINRNGRFEINSNNYIYNLFKNGFRLGHNESNKNLISAGLTGVQKANFEEGFNS